MPILRWPKDDRISFHGRNGTGFCTGVQLSTHRNPPDGSVAAVTFSPVLSSTGSRALPGKRALKGRR